MSDSVTPLEDGFIEIFGAREHNLRNINVNIPRNKLVVITGLSGSGKSSLAFDTLYAEGQRRYMESFSAYARNFLGNLKRPDVDKINGLSPVISIEQKTTNTNPRSTVGTVTEIYDFLRLLYARAGEARSYVTGEKMIQHTEPEITNRILEEYKGMKISILAPMVKGRKGHYRELFQQLMQSGYLKVRIDDELVELKRGLQTDRYKTHDIEVLIDRLQPSEEIYERLQNSVRSALDKGKGSLMILIEDQQTVRNYSQLLICPTSGISYQEPAPNSFSFNSPYGACKKCNGLGTVPEIDMKAIIPDKKLTIKKGGLSPVGSYKDNWIFRQLEALGKHYDFNLNTPVSDLSEDALKAILYGSEDVLNVNRNYGDGFSHNYSLSFEGIINFITSRLDDDASPALKKWAQSFMSPIECSDCNGSRLNRESLHFFIGDSNIAEVASMDIIELNQWVEQLDPKLSKKQKLIAQEILKEIKKRIKFLLDVGLDYISLNRSSKSLSGGESQRIRLATQIGSQLVGVLYILDEPSIGLHQRDNMRLINSLHELRDSGNSVIVVEHDKDTIMNADYVLDLGPGAGLHGGKVMSHGLPSDIKNSDTLTAKYLTGKMQIPNSRKLKGNKQELKVFGASGNNLKDVDVSIPLGSLTIVTGVSGSGKSTLINETLYPFLANHFYHSSVKPLPFKKIQGYEELDKVIEVDQSPIGRTPRSNPATYTGVFTDIRNLFAQLPEAQIRGYKPGSFSFNVKGGRCENCQGAGMKTIAMNFLPDVYVPCEECGGNRYNSDILAVRYKGKSISDVLNMSIDHACEFFESIPSIFNKLKTLKEVGLGYLSIGQQSTTLSGGEAQRVKLSTELSKRDTGNTIYILDEPTTGLHFEDVRILMNVLFKLIDKGNTVLIIEHNLDVILAADYIIDLGPEGGRRGGEIVYQGPLDGIVKCKDSITGQFVKKEIEERLILN